MAVKYRGSKSGGQHEQPNYPDNNLILFNIHPTHIAGGIFCSIHLEKELFLKVALSHIMYLYVIKIDYFLIEIKN